MMAFIGLLAVVAGVSLAHLRQQAEKIKEDKGRKYYEMAMDTVDMVVAEINQTFTDQIKADHDGKLTAEEGKKAFDIAFGKVKQILGQEAQRYLSEITGDVNELLKAAIESSVAMQKKE